MPTSEQKLTIGLTGGIGSGKSSVAQCFSQLGITVLSADHIARQLVQASQPNYQTIIDHFGDGILTATGEINRQQLKSIIFNQATEKKWLEALLHPQIWASLQQAALAANSPYVIAEIPLLVESQKPSFIKRVLVVDSTESSQIQRVMARDQLSQHQVKKILHQQASRQQRLAMADDVIYNDDEREHLTERVKQLHNQYLNMLNR